MENIQNELNALKNDGWELVSVQNIRLDDGGLFSVAYLKRKKPTTHKKPISTPIYLILYQYIKQCKQVTRPCRAVWVWG